MAQRSQAGNAAAPSIKRSKAARMSRFIGGLTTLKPGVIQTNMKKPLVSGRRCQPVKSQLVRPGSLIRKNIMVLKGQRGKTLDRNPVIHVGGEGSRLQHRGVLQKIGSIGLRVE